MTWEEKKIHLIVKQSSTAPSRNSGPYLGGEKRALRAIKVKRKPVGSIQGESLAGKQTGHGGSREIMSEGEKGIGLCTLGGRKSTMRKGREEPCYGSEKSKRLGGGREE